MSKKLFIGNFPYNTTEQDIIQLFSEQGTVVQANIVHDRVSGRSRGFGFVSYETDEVAARAQQALNGIDFGGRKLRVDMAQDRDRQSVKEKETA